MIFTLETELNTDEVRRKAEIHQILTGNGRPEKFAADATHVFEASKYAGYFITADRRILEKRSELREICAAMIVTPTEWLAIYRAHI